MALVTLVGYPCSGKTRFARLLEQDLRRRLADVNYAGPKLDVVVVDDEGSHVSRTVYDGQSSFIDSSFLEIPRSSNLRHQAI